MSFKELVKENWLALLIGSLFLLAVIGLAIAAPFLLPAAFAVITGSWALLHLYVISTALVASIIGFVAGALTHILRSPQSSKSDVSLQAEVSAEPPPARSYEAMTSLIRPDQQQALQNTGTAAEATQYASSDDSRDDLPDDLADDLAPTQGHKVDLNLRLR